LAWNEGSAVSWRSSLSNTTRFFFFIFVIDKFLAWNEGRTVSWRISSSRTTSFLFYVFLFIIFRHRT
jgi:hypothetical protein